MKELVRIDDGFSTSGDGTIEWWLGAFVPIHRACEDEVPRIKTSLSEGGTKVFPGANGATAHALKYVFSPAAICPRVVARTLKTFSFSAAASTFETARHKMVMPNCSLCLSGSLCIPPRSGSCVRVSRRQAITPSYSDISRDLSLREAFECQSQSKMIRTLFR